MHIFFFYSYGHHRHLHSFPTRRSSDLANILGAIGGTPTIFRTDEPTPVLDIQTETDVASILNSYAARQPEDRKSTRLNSSHTVISYAVFCLKKKKYKLHTN